MQVTSLGGSRYFMIIKDDASGYRKVYFMKHKSDVYECFKEFEVYIRNHFGNSMKVLRIDSGLEFTNKKLT